MSKKGRKINKKQTTVQTFDRRAIFLHLIKIALLTIICLFLWISCLTFDPGDWPNANTYPHNDPIANWCGPVGAWISYNLFHFIGQGAWPFLLFVTICSFVLITGSELTGWIFRIIGMLILTAVSSSILALIQPAWPAGLPEGSGGVIGLAIVSFLQQFFSKFGTSLILLFSLAVGLILAADELVIYLPEFLRRTSQTFKSFAKIFAEKYLSPSPEKVKRIKALPAMAGADSTSTAQQQRAERQESLEEDNNTETEQNKPIERVEPKIFVSRTLEQKKPSKKAMHAVRSYDDWELPPLDLLNDEKHQLADDHEERVRRQARILEKTLAEFKIEAVVVEIDTGPVVTMFELMPAPGTKIQSLSDRSKDLARALKAPSVRVVAPIPGKDTIGIEVPNLDKQPVRLRELIDLSGDVPSSMEIPLFLGKDASGNPLVYDLTSMPHLLIAGTTGSGKSVCINSIIMSILLTQRPSNVKMILVDPKMVELSSFKDIPHLMCPVVHDSDRAEAILEWLVQKMEERYAILAEAQVRNIHAYNRLGREELIERFKPANEEEQARIQTTLPYIVFVIDELADLMMVSPKEVELHLARLAQKSRAVGIHMILATQRPEAKVVTGLIKSNLPTRIAFRVNSRLDSRIVLDQKGAEDLLGQGDMLFLPPGSGEPVRAQGTLVDDVELRRVLKYLSERGEPEFFEELMQIGKVDLNNIEQDELFDEAVRIVLETRRGSVSLLQRRLNIGYSRASRLIEQMAAAGIVGEYKGSQAREVTMTLEEYEAIKRQMEEEISEGMTN